MLVVFCRSQARTAVNPWADGLLVGLCRRLQFPEFCAVKHRIFTNCSLSNCGTGEEGAVGKTAVPTAFA